MQQMNVATAYAPISIPAKAKLLVNYLHLCRAAVGLKEATARKWKERGIGKWYGMDVDYHTLPPTVTTPYRLPDPERLLAQVAQFKSDDAQNKLNTQTASNADVDSLYHDLCAAKLNFHSYHNNIAEKYTVGKEQCKLVAQRWAVWQRLTDIWDGHSDSNLHKAYELVFPGHLTAINSFRNYKKAIDLKGLEAKIIDGRLIAKGTKRITSFQYAMLQSLYIQPQKITAPAAHKKLVTACEGLSEKPYSLASVKNYFREFERNMELYTARYGAGAAQKLMPHATLLAAQHRNTQWQIDGWTMPFWGAGFQRYVLHMVRDNHSRKVLGYSIAESENTTLILAGLEDAMSVTGCFPGELVSDKHSFHQTKIATRLKAETEKMGAVWTVTINAQRNQLAERYGQYLDALCKDFPGYLGKNMTATSKDARPSPEAMAQLAKTANFKTFDEIRAIAAYCVKEFNKTPLEVLNGQSPNEAYEASADVNCFKLTEADRINLLRPATAYKVIRGQITIKVGMKKHEFQLSAHLISRYNNRELLVVYEDLEQGIYVSDPKSGEELGCIHPKPKIHGAIFDQTDQDRQLLNKLTGRSNGVTVPARKAAHAKIAEALKDNPEAIELINHFSLPKDIRQLAAQDLELKRAMADSGINVNNLPIRTNKAAVLEMPAPAAQKTKAAPFSANGEGAELVDKWLSDEF